MSETRQQKKQSFAEKWGLKPDYTVDSWTLAEAVAGDLFERMDARAAEGMTLDQVLRWFRKPQDEESWQPQYLDEWDRRRVFDLLARLACPPPCAGVVRGEGWHQECQKKAQTAMSALGISPPPIDSIPPRDTDWEA